jgi:hypothetical protein
VNRFEKTVQFQLGTKEKKRENQTAKQIRNRICRRLWKQEAGRAGPPVNLTSLFNVKKLGYIFPVFFISKLID